MPHKTLIGAEELLKNIDNPEWVVVDCRFALHNTQLGAQNYRRGHLPNARYAHIDNDLSGTITQQTGRHPLPDLHVLSRTLGLWGISNQTQVIAYDDANGAFAGRLWWLLRHLGHSQAAVLDGGITRWKQLGYPQTTALPKIDPTNFRAYPELTSWVTAGQIQDGLAAGSICVLDARAPERFRGEIEPIDPVAGHVRGALNRPFQNNLNFDGTFLPPEVLRQQFQTLSRSKQPQQVVHMCGSGITACHNLLAMEHAGLEGSRLYAGSWSEWIRNKNRPTARG